MQKQKTPPEIIARFREKDEFGINKPDINQNLSKELIAEFNLFLEEVSRKTDFDAFDLVDEVYEWIDRIMEIKLNGLSVCSRGCAHCCKVPVSLTKLEADYISERTGKKIDETGKVHKSYCPLLSKNNGECTVYKYRPVNCRVWLTFTNPDNCKDKHKENWSFGHQAYWTLEHHPLKTLQEIIYGLDTQCGNDTNIDNDIRQFFRRK